MNEYYMKLNTPVTLRDWYDIEQRVLDSGVLEGDFSPFVNNNLHLVVGVFLETEEDAVLFSLLMF